jgi:hypothetical protein
VDAGGQSVKAQVGREEAVVILKSERVDLSLQDSGSVPKLWCLDGPKKDVTAMMIVKMEVEFFLKAEIEKEILGKQEDIICPGPNRDRYRIGRIETQNSQLQDTPEVVISAVWVIANQDKRSIDLRRGRAGD